MGCPAERGRPPSAGMLSWKKSSFRAHTHTHTMLHTHKRKKTGEGSIKPHDDVNSDVNTPRRTVRNFPQQRLRSNDSRVFFSFFFFILPVLRSCIMPIGIMQLRFECRLLQMFSILVMQFVSLKCNSMQSQFVYYKCL